MNLLNMLLMCAGMTGTATGEAADGTAQGGSSWYIIVIYVAIFAAFIYFIMIRPQRKQKQQQEETYSSLQPGDSVLTTSGFYGTIVAVNGDTIIVEFGNNKNCRIPMAKQAISQVEKAGSAGAGAAAATSADASPIKKFFGRKKTDDSEQIESAPQEGTQTQSEAQSPDSSESSPSESSSDNVQ